MLILLNAACLAEEQQIPFLCLSVGPRIKTHGLPHKRLAHHYSIEGVSCFFGRRNIIMKVIAHGDICQLYVLELCEYYVGDSKWYHSMFVIDFTFLLSITPVTAHAIKLCQ